MSSPGQPGLLACHPIRRSAGFDDRPTNRSIPAPRTPTPSQPCSMLTSSPDDQASLNDLDRKAAPYGRVGRIRFSKCPSPTAPFRIWAARSSSAGIDASCQGDVVKPHDRQRPGTRMATSAARSRPMAVMSFSRTRPRAAGAVPSASRARCVRAVRPSITAHHQARFRQPAFSSACR
jgi:hypothetical protein